jgi:hypothetical protein
MELENNTDRKEIHYRPGVKFRKVDKKVYWKGSGLMRDDRELGKEFDDEANGVDCAGRREIRPIDSSIAHTKRMSKPTSQLHS